jgi:hypothetical protein
MTAGWRALAARWPSLARGLRPLAELAWWTISLQLPERLKDIKRFRDGVSLISKAGSFDPEWYLARYPDVAAAGQDPLRHYLRYGAKEGRDPNAVFDTSWYLENYPDVTGSKLNPFVHYLKFGISEGRDAGPRFQTARYLSPPLIASGGNLLVHSSQIRPLNGRSEEVSESSNQIRKHYDAEFYGNQVEGSTKSAKVVVPYVMQLLQPVDSVIDVGCGTGAWLRQFEIGGVNVVFGIDGGDVNDSFLQIEPDCFLQYDLDKPIRLDRRFDLCMSIEVAEHLPASRGESFVVDLCRLADSVLFGAAVPGQGGHNHVNERWASYWVSLFSANGYVCHDVIRPRIWNDARVEWWYAQNTLLFINERRTDLLARLSSNEPSAVLDVVHPRCFVNFHGS